MLNKKAEFVTLQALKQCRADMVQDCLSHNTEIYMQTALNRFIQAGENAENLHNILEVALEKNSVLFNRRIKQLSEEKL